MKFAIQRQCSCEREGVAVHQTCVLNKYPVVIVDNCEEVPVGYVPVGSVEFCLSCLKSNVIPDYYPTFLTEHLHRYVSRTDAYPVGFKMFVKPADQYKRFDGFITDGYVSDIESPYWVSEVVIFKNEWRYYILNGIVVDSGWYDGENDTDTPNAPELNIKIPDWYCGAIDMGIMERDGKEYFALVEASHPFACGWYGKNAEAYTHWLFNGWKYMLDKTTHI